VSSTEHLPSSFPKSLGRPYPSKEEESPTAGSARSNQQVSPELAGFIERVVVPALVKRYIAQLSPTGERGE
jgi:hypothetical protein